MIAPYFCILLYPFLGLLGIFVTHWVLSRWIKDHHWGIMVGAFLVWLLWVLFKTGAAGLQGAIPMYNVICYVFLNGVIFAGLGYGYFTLFNLNISAIRIRLLKQLSAAKDGLPEQTLLKDYHPEVMIDLRIKRLMKLKQIHCENDGHCIMKRKELKCLVDVIQKIRRWLGISPRV